MKDSYLIEQLKNGDLGALDELYILHKNAFFRFGNTFSVSQEDLTDIYQDTIIIFYENVRTGKLTHLSSTIRTYLFGIGKRLIYQLLRRQGLSTKLIDLEESETNYVEQWIEEEALTQQHQHLLIALEKMGDSCRRLLQLFYYEEVSIRQIMELMNYASENTVKAHKSRCLKSLRTLFLQLP